jgi:prepilin-type N-terminal cleavage/methylation domain-containing protein
MRARQAARPMGFTLIELLIVVAIIAILAAIAVPNFLEAQTRSKVSRVKADLRTLTTAVEAYYVDNNGYPTGWDIIVNPAATASHSLFLLSTPIAYITSGDLQDPFQEHRDDTPMYTTLQWDPMTNDGDMISSYNQPEAKATWWIIFSVGPDKSSGFYAGEPEFDVQAKVKNAGTAPADLIATIYDPTNGTTSVGNIWKVGGGSGAHPAGQILAAHP